MSRAWAVPYQSFPQGTPPRPMLVMTVIAPNGTRGNRIGIIDSGADLAGFPFEYASIMGYSADDLEEQQIQAADGVSTTLRAKFPCEAFIPEVPDIRVSLLPTFNRGLPYVLWGRMDFMRSFHVTFRETEQRFILEEADGAEDNAGIA
jgi:hypothetical protein